MHDSKNISLGLFFVFTNPRFKSQNPKGSFLVQNLPVTIKVKCLQASGTPSRNTLLEAKCEAGATWKPATQVVKFYINASRKLIHAYR